MNILRRVRSLSRSSAFASTDPGEPAKARTVKSRRPATQSATSQPLAAAIVAGLVVLGATGLLFGSAERSGSLRVASARAAAPSAEASAPALTAAAAPPSTSPAPAPGAATTAPAAAAVASAAAPGTAPAKVTHFKGIVHDDKQQPLPGATVTIVSVKTSDKDEDARERPNQGGPRGPMRAMGRLFSSPEDSKTFFTAKTDPAGAFVLDAEGEGPFHLRVDAPGFAPAFVDELKGGEGATTAVTLQRGVSATGTIGEAGSGVPILDAEVLAVVQPDHGFNDPDDPKRFTASARSGRGGVFTIPNLLPSFYTFRVVAPGRAAFEDSDKPVGDPSARPLVFYLARGFDVSGRVLDPAGKPLPKASIAARPARRGTAMLKAFAGGSGDFTLAHGRSDKDGRYTLRGVPLDGAYTLEAGARDLPPASVEIPAPRAGAVSGLDIRFEKGSAMRAKLVDSDQKPVTAGVSATLSYRDPKTRRLLRTVERSADAVQALPTGEISVDKLPAGLASVTIRTSGFKDVEKADVPIGRDPKGTDLGTLTLDRGKKISGRVVDDDGKPIALARVSATSFALGRGPSTGRAKTDASGRFTLGGLDAADNWTLEAEASGYSSASKSEIASDADGVEIVLPRAGEIKGRIVFGDPPRPLTNFTIEASPKGGDGAPMARIMRARPISSHQSDAGGAFTLRDLAPGSYTLAARADGFQELTREGVDVRAADTTDLGDLSLEAGGTIRGHVVSKPDNLPVAGAVVRVKSSALFDMRAITGDRSSAVLTDLSGGFELRGLPTGTVTVQAEPEGFARAEQSGVKVEAGVPTDDVVINVGKGGRIEGRVLGDDGRPKSGTMISAMAGIADFSARLSATTDDQGRYAIENVAPGSYRVMNLPFGGDGEDDGGGGGSSGRRPGFGMDAMTAEVKDGETAVVNFGEKKIVVSGTVKRKEGSTSSLVVAFVPSGSRGRAGLQMANTDDSGHYEVKLSEPGDYQVYVGDQGMRGGAAVSVTVPDKPDFAYDIEMPDGRVTGRISDGKGAGVKGVMIIAAPVKVPGKPAQIGNAGARTTSEEDGSYTLRDLTPGSYDISFSKEGFGAEKREGVVVKGTDETSIDLILDSGLPIKVRVVSPTGSSVPGALVMVGTGGALFQGLGGMTTDDGTVELKSLKAGTYTFIAVTRDYAPGISSTVTLGGEDAPDTAQVNLAQGGRAHILIQDGAKKPISGAQISLDSPDTPELGSVLTIQSAMQGLSATTRDDGTLDLDKLPPGKYDVSVKLKDKTVSRSMTVEDGGKASLTVTVDSLN